jgi:hypothetical protein
LVVRLAAGTDAAVSPGERLTTSEKVAAEMTNAVSAMPTAFVCLIRCGNPAGEGHCVVAIRGADHRSRPSLSISP